MANEVIKFDLGKEPITKKSLVGTVISVSASLSYSKTLVDGESTILEGKAESVNLGNMFGMPVGIGGTTITAEQQNIIDAEEVAKQEIAAALIKYNTVKLANTPTT